MNRLNIIAKRLARWLRNKSEDLKKAPGHIREMDTEIVELVKN